jgi:hypothetical protein
MLRHLCFISLSVFIHATLSRVQIHRKAKRTVASSLQVSLEAEISTHRQQPDAHLITATSFCFYALLLPKIAVFGRES